MIENYKVMVYGTMIIDSNGRIYKIEDGYTDDKGIDRFELKPIFEHVIVDADYVKRNCFVITENPLGKELFV